MAAGQARGRAPRGTLDRGVIVRAATRLLHDEGADAVTTRRIAAELGVRPMALYTHFRSKDEILVALYDQLVTRIEVPAPDGGLAALREVMRAYFRLAVAHPDLFRATTTHDAGAAHELRLAEATYAILMAEGLDPRRAVGVRAALMRLTVGAAVLYPPRQAWDDDAGHWPRVAASMRALPAAEFPMMHALAADLPEFTQEQAFEFGLDLILDAVRR